MKRLILCLALAAGAVNAQQAQQARSGESAAVVRQATVAAQAALVTLRGLVTDSTARGFGFDSARDAQAATIGTPIPVYMVQLDELREYAPQKDPDSLLHPLNKAIVPVNVRESVRSSIVIEQVKSKWTATSFGAPNLAVSLTQTRDNVARASSSSAATLFAVHVAALNRYYVANGASGELTLTPIIDEPDTQLRASATLPARDVLARLVPLARQYNGLPL
jgi:hypothetical protein